MSGVLISQAIENDILSWTEPEAARFARLETKAVQRPHSGLQSVSAVRMVRPRPFEATRKFALSGGAVGVCDGKMAARVSRGQAASAAGAQQPVQWAAGWLAGLGENDHRMARGA